MGRYVVTPALDNELPTNLGMQHFLLPLEYSTMCCLLGMFLSFCLATFSSLPGINLDATSSNFP